MMVLVSPSIVSSSLVRLYDEVKKCEQAGAFSLHLDIMDGHFVPNITMGPDFVRAIRDVTDLRLESHLMLERPDRYYQKFREAGSDTILIHVESPMSTGHLIKRMETEGCRYGIVINPETPVEKAYPFLEKAEILLIMSVHPGYSGQAFIRDVIPKIKAARRYIDAMGLKTSIEIDGGINERTGAEVAEAGADILVSASYIFSGNVAERISTLKAITPAKAL